EQKARIAEAFEGLQLAQTQLVQSAKMAALGELVAGVAHEINNPLAFATSHLDTAQHSLQQVYPFIANQLPDEALSHWDKAATRLREMRVGLDRISALVTQLRTFSRLDEGARKTIDFRECVDSVLMILGHRLTAGIQVELALAGPPRFDCYPGPLNLALLNLVANALDATGGEGRITIATEVRDDHMYIGVSDNGVGI